MRKKPGEPTTEIGRFMLYRMSVLGIDGYTELGKRAGIDPSLPSKWATGTEPTLKSLRKVAPILSDEKCKVTPGDLLVVAGLMDHAELGLDAKSRPLPPTPRPLHPTLAKLDRILSDPNISAAKKGILARTLEAAYEMWADAVVLRTAHEPPAAKRGPARAAR